MFSLLIEGRTLIKNKLNNLRQTKSKHTTDTSILDKRVRFRSVCIVYVYVTLFECVALLLD